MISETFSLKVLDQSVIVKHEGKHRLNKAEKTDIKGFIREDLLKDKESGFHPYNNFECAWEWSLVAANQPA